VAQLYPQALDTHFSRLLRHAWVTVGLLFNPGHHTGRGYAYANGFVVLTEGPDMFGLRAIATDGKNNPEGMGSPWLKASAACGNPGPSLKTTDR
jgi:hypothetical protein